MTVANLPHIQNLLTEALNSRNDNGDLPDGAGAVSSMSGELRTAARRLAKELGFDSATVSSSVLKSVLACGAQHGPSMMVERYAQGFSGVEETPEVPHIPKTAQRVWKSTRPETPQIVTPEERRPCVVIPSDSSTEDAAEQPPAQAAVPAGKQAVIQQMQELMAQALAPDNTASGITEKEVIALIETYAHKPAEKHIIVSLPGGKRDMGEKLVHEQFDSVLKAVAADVAVMLVGPAGSGKTTLCEQVAEALGLRFYFTGAVASEYKLSGFVDAQGRVVSTAFRDAYTNGGLFLFDEVDASMPQAIMAFNAALANGHCDFPGDTEPTKRHPDFRVIAAANTFGRGADRQYVGRNQLDAASLDRFIVVNMDYDNVLERALAGNRDWTKRVQRIRREIQKQQVRHIVSPRASIQGAKLLAAGFSVDEVLEATVWKGLDADTKSRITSAISS